MYVISWVILTHWIIGSCVIIRKSGSPGAIVHSHKIGQGYEFQKRQLQKFRVSLGAVGKQFISQERVLFSLITKYS